ncbi:copper chaperone for superoxide dismutase [Anabrus simplex]|uniref:copper chaperone for superoxide dismutase n=1 Tax=Anabrus simplex TaxID=316456 RepID=UPI0034DD8A55
MASKIEFAVQMTCESCANSVKSSLAGVPGVNNVTVSLPEETVIVETTLPSSEIQKLIESSGRRAILKGYGDSAKAGHQGAAVAMLGGLTGSALGDVKGVVRFVQVDEDTCVVDGTLDGLSPGPHGLHVHECGDLSQGCDSIGEHFNPYKTQHGSPKDEPQMRHAGDLGNITADENGRATFRLTDRVLKVWDLIGRSVAVTEKEDDLGRGNSPESTVNGNSGTRLACGIIARSAGMFENSKKICACDGVSLWDERDKPLAGPGRRTETYTANL